MERMTAKQSREVQIALDNDRVERDGDLRLQTRKARQAVVELLKIQGGHSELSEQLDSLLKDHNAMVKTIARERRQHSVDTQTLYVIVSPNPNSNPLLPFLTLCFPWSVGKANRLDASRGYKFIRDLVRVACLRLCPGATESMYQEVLRGLEPHPKQVEDAMMRTVSSMIHCLNHISLHDMKQDWRTVLALFESKLRMLKEIMPTTKKVPCDRRLTLTITLALTLTSAYRSHPSLGFLSHRQCLLLS